MVFRLRPQLREPRKRPATSENSMHIRRATFLILVLPILLAIVAAYVQWLIVGLPPVTTSSRASSMPHTRKLSLFG